MHNWGFRKCFALILVHTVFYFPFLRSLEQTTLRRLRPTFPPTLRCPTPARTGPGWRGFRIRQRKSSLPAPLKPRLLRRGSRPTPRRRHKLAHAIVGAYDATPFSTPKKIIFVIIKGPTAFSLLCRMTPWD